MSIVAGGGDAWRISGEDRAKHDSQFFTLKPVNGFVTGEQARGFFMQSGLPTPVLGQIWGLADINNDGKMDKKEFSIAMHLIKKKLQGYELPKSLPTSLKADPSPMMGSFGTMPPQPQGMMGMAPGIGMPPVGMAPPVSMAMGQRMPMMANGMPQMIPSTGFMGAPGVPVSGGFSGGMPRPAGPQPTPGGNLAMPHQSRLKYTQMFNTHDRNKRGSLTGVEARAILLQTGVPQQMLAQIWTLSDVDKDGKLNCDEFCIAMHLIDIVRMGQVLPAKLPPELIPGKSRAGSFGSAPSSMPQPAGPKDSFGDLVGSMGMPAPVQPAPAANGETKLEEIDTNATFEDKRKENFDKGQAELERRRQMLQEQLRQEKEARMEKERKEQEKREKQRQEQERKKQLELERQMEKQREMERQREEQRQKMMEQREAARRELERQRQMEWERQRKEQLMAEKTREYEQLMALKSRSSDLKCELESLQGKKTEFSTKISQVKNGVTDFTAHIEAMRSTRDLKNNDIERLQGEIQEVNRRLSTLQSDRQTLDLRVQTTVQANPMSETHRTMMHSVEVKKTSVQKLKKDLEQMERETETKLAEIDSQNSQLAELNKTITQLQSDISRTEKSNQESAKKKTDEQEQTRKEKEKQEKLKKELEAQKLKESASAQPAASQQSAGSTGGGNWFAFGGAETKTAATSNNDNWASVFDNQGETQTSSVDWSAAFSSQATNQTADTGFKLSGSKQKYKAMYQFDARNADELTLNPGDIVMVFDDQTGAEPGWRGGEMNGKCGWFPEAYVVKEEESSQSAFPSVDVNPGLSSSGDSSFMVVAGKMPAVSPTPGQGQAAPEGLQAQALYPWKAKKDNHLTFNKGDIILVKEQQDMWWSGEVGGKVGWFPKSYVKLISGPSTSTTPVPSLSLTSDSPVSVQVTATQDPGPAGSTDTSAGETYIGVYMYQSSEPGDLTFNQGEIIQVTKKDGDWWTGSTGGRSGIFPANYVKKHDVQLDDAKELTSKSSMSNLDSDLPDNLNASNTFSEDPFANVSEDPFANVSANTDPGFPNDPFNKTGNDQQSLFTEDPFANVGNSVDNTFSKDPFPNADNSNETTISGDINSNQSSSNQDQFIEDPFLNINQDKSSSLKNDGNEVQGGFTEDPFANAATDNTISLTEDPFAGSESKGPNEDPFGSNVSKTGSGFSDDPFGNSDPFSDNLSKTETENKDPVKSSDPFSDNLSKTETENKDPVKSSDPFSDNLSKTETENKDPVKSIDPFSDNLSKTETENKDPVKSSDPFSDNSSKSETEKKDPFENSGLILENTSKTEIGFDDAWNSDSFVNPDDKSKNDTFGDMDPFSSSTSNATFDLGSPFPDDPFKNTGSTDNPVAFADDPFKDKNSVIANDSNFGIFDNFTMDDTSEKVQSVNSSSMPLDSGAKTAAFDILDQSSNWLASMERDAIKFPPPDDLGPLVSQSAIAGGLDSSSQTGASLMNLSSLSPVSTPGSNNDLSSDPGIKPRSNSASKSKLGPPRPPPPATGGKLKKAALDPPKEESVDQKADNVHPKQAAAAAPVTASSSSTTAESSLSTTSQSGTSSSTSSGMGTLKKPEIATVIAQYTATGDEQLSLSPGQLIQVRKKSPSGWWEGELQARGQKRKIGWFPANYVKLLGGSARNTPDMSHGGKTSPATTSMGQSSATPSPAPQTSTTPQPSSQSYVDHVIALYPYNAQHADELTFQKDAVINVLKKDDPDWWQGEYNGKTGMFPSNYVQSSTPESSASWSEDPQVLAVTSAEESKRQSYIHELINTEETYMNDMSIVLEAFYNPIKQNEALSDDHLQAIFVNWKDLIVCNTKLQKALRVRKKMCGHGQVINSIGDILCENIPHLTPYIRFCSCQLNAAALLQRISESNQKFNEIHKKCVQNPKTKGMPLSSFLLKPMQRITKYPLLVEKILKYTPESHPDHNHLKEALETCQELCSQVNEGVREKENSDRLEYIQQHVHCDGLPEKITFNSVTNCLGPRKLLHTGVVYKSKSNKELAAFLFNDFLMLTTSNRPLNNTTHSLFDLTGQVQYKMYKTPVFLNEVMIRKANTDDSESFTISHIDRVYNLKCHSQSERDTWMKRLETASKHYLDTERKKREKAISSPKHTKGVGRLLVIILEGSNLISSKDVNCTLKLRNSVRHTPGTGRLLVVIVEGIDLKASDANGKSDPYCEVSMGAQEHKTKVINNTLNPKWNASMQFTIRDIDMDALCITVFDRDLFSPNDFLGRTEIRVKDILKETGAHERRPVVKKLLLHEVATGEIVVKLDLHIFEP